MFPSEQDEILNSNLDGATHLYEEGILGTSIEALKSMGGYEFENVSFTFIPAVENAAIDPDSQKLVTARVIFKVADQMQCANMAADLFEKLEAQYGTFEKYASDAYSWQECIDVVKEKHPDIKMGYDQVLQAIRFGANDTVLLLRVDSWWRLDLYYTKIGTMEAAEEIRTIAESMKVTVSDAGL